MEKYKKKYTITADNARKGFEAMIELSNRLANESSKNDFLNYLFPEKQNHHIDYLKSKTYYSELYKLHPIGSLYVSFKNIPDNDRKRIVDWLYKKYNIKEQDIIVAQWIAKWTFNYLNYLEFEKILKSDNFNNSVDIEAEWKKYKNIGLERYLYQLDDNNLNKFIDWANNKRLKHIDNYKYNFIEEEYLEHYFI